MCSAYIYNVKWDLLVLFGEIIKGHDIVQLFVQLGLV